MTEEVKTKICNKGPMCIHPEGPSQPITNFNKRKASPDGHTYTCKTCERESAKASYARRKEAGLIKPLTKEEHEAKKQFYRDYYQENKERKKKYDAKYRQSEKGKEIMKEGHKRRKQRLKEQAGDPYEIWEVVEKCTKDGVLICEICELPIERLRDAQKDHITPIADGGKDELDNVRMVHKTCNLTRPKGDTT